MWSLGLVSCSFDRSQRGQSALVSEFWITDSLSHQTPPDSPHWYSTKYCCTIINYQLQPYCFPLGSYNHCVKSSPRAVFSKTIASLLPSYGISRLQLPQSPYLSAFRRSDNIRTAFRHFRTTPVAVQSVNVCWHNWRRREIDRVGLMLIIDYLGILEAIRALWSRLLTLKLTRAYGLELWSLRRNALLNECGWRSNQDAKTRDHQLKHITGACETC
jgi:hypothetical protein